VLGSEEDEEDDSPSEEDELDFMLLSPEVSPKRQQEHHLADPRSQPKNPFSLLKNLNRLEEGSAGSRFMQPASSL